MYHLRLSGEPRERGRIHGEELRGPIASILGLWQTDIEKQTGLAAGDYLSRFRAGTDFLPAIQRWTPQLLEEVRGIAEGAAQEFEALLAFQCMDEDWWFRELCLPGHCSAIASRSPGGPALLAQNMDIHRMTDGYQTVMQIAEGERETLVFSFAGFLGLTGLNNSPLGVCVNTLDQLNHSSRGLPVAFIVRVLLEQDHVDRAADFLRTVPHASGQNYLMADGTDIRDFECSAAGAVEVQAGRPVICHTNHPLASRDFHSELHETPAPALASNSQRRLDLLEGRAAAGPVTDASLREIMRTPPVCVERTHDDDFFTSGSLIMTLASPPRLDLSVGPPSQSEYQALTVRDSKERHP